MQHGESVRKGCCFTDADTNKAFSYRVHVVTGKETSSLCDNNNVIIVIGSSRSRNPLWLHHLRISISEVKRCIELTVKDTTRRSCQECKGNACFRERRNTAQYINDAYTSQVRLDDDSGELTNFQNQLSRMDGLSSKLVRSCLHRSRHAQRLGPAHCSGAKIGWHAR